MNWLRFIAALEMAGGALGSGFVLWALLANPLDGLTALIALFVLAANALSFVAGVALWSGSRAGRVLSVIVQVIQLPKVVSVPVVFMFSFGLDVWVSIAQAAGQVAWGFHLIFLSSSQVYFNVPVTYGLGGVSITSIVFLAVLIGHKGETPAEISEPPPPLPPPDWQQPEEQSAADSHE